jgi:class 3 adenylate cyclase
MATPKSDLAAPERTPVVILFAETRGFTRTSGILEPSVVVARVSEFFTLVWEAVEGNGGAVRNVLNDTLAASFAGEGRAMRAVQAAQKIQYDFNAFEETLEHGYGIRAAVAIAGSGFKLEAEELPPLEIPRREPIRLYGVLRDARLDFT